MGEKYYTAKIFLLEKKKKMPWNQVKNMFAFQTEILHP